MRRRLAVVLLTAPLTACGGGSAPPVDTALALAPSYSAVGVSKVLPDGLTVARLDVFAFRLEALQSSGGRAAGEVVVEGRRYPVEGTFDAETGALRFDAFDAVLTSTRAERVDALGGRGDEGRPADGLADTLSGFVQTSSGAVFQTDGEVLAVADREDNPRLDVARVSAVEDDLGRFLIEAEPGFADPGVGVEVFVFSLFEDEATFRLLQANGEGGLAVSGFDGVPGDVIVLRGLRAGRVGPPVFLRVREG